MSERVFTLTLQTNETQRWISFYFDLSKPAVPFVLGSQIHKELSHEEVSIGPMIEWDIWIKTASPCVCGGLRTMCMCTFTNLFLRVSECIELCRFRKLA